MTGRLTSEGERIGGLLSVEFRHVFEYDEAGRVVNEDMRWGSLGSMRRRLRYNEFGNVEAEAIGQESLFHPEAAEFVKGYWYRYDGPGSWTERTGAGTVERRELTCF